jgi:uncharacterized protein (UPF0548 family)
LFLQKPSAEAVARFLATQADLPFSYPDVGASASTPPVGYDVDRTRVKLGEGEAVYLAAASAIKRWQQFRLGWVDVWPRDAAIQEGVIVAVIGQAIGFWWLNACRIIYVVNETGPISRFGFGYGTLPGHKESGEERFLIEFNRADNSVWYDILAFSRPNHYLTRLGYPVVRRLQKRFGRHSSAAMLKVCSLVK